MKYSEVLADIATISENEFVTAALQPYHSEIYTGATGTPSMVSGTVQTGYQDVENATP